MKEKHKDEIRKLFDTAKMRTGEIKQQLKSVENSDKQFLEKFGILCKDCINPTIKEVGSHIKEMGGDYRVEEFQEEQLRQLGISGMPFLRLTITIPGYDLKTHRGDIPSLIFAGDKHRLKVTCNLENIGHLSVADHQIIRQWAIDEITSDRVEKAIISYMKVLVPV